MHQQAVSNIMKEDRQRAFDLAVEQLGQGRSVIPMKIIEGEKRPLVKWATYQENLPTEQDLTDWYAKKQPDFWAIVTGSVSDLVVLDFDGQAGIETMERLGLEPHIKTGSGGYHVWFKHPGFRVKTDNHRSDRQSNDKYPGMDMRGDGGIAGFAGWNAKGEYKALRELVPDDLTPEVRAILEEYKSGEGRELRVIPLPSVAVDPMRYLQDALDAVSLVGKRNINGFHLCRKLRDAGLDEDEALAVMLDYQERVPDFNPIRGVVEPYTVEEVEATVRSVYSRKPKLNYPLTDTGNGERLAALFGDVLRYCPDTDSWYVWNGQRWERDEVGRIWEYAKGAIRPLYAEAQSLDGEDKKRLFSHIVNSESEYHTGAMIRMAGRQPGMTVRVRELDAFPWLINVPNGTLDLRTGELREALQGAMMTRSLTVPYDPDAKCPTWERFLSEVFDGHQDLIDYVQRAVGYTLTGLTTEQCLFFMYGGGKNGKSTFIETLKALFGDYGLKITRDLVLASRPGAIPNDVAMLPGARLAVTQEVEEDVRLAEAKVKDLTGGDEQTARFLHQEYFSFAPTHKIWMYGNHKPVVKGTDNGIWRRIKLIPFKVSFEGRADPDMLDNLKVELQGILTWAVRGCVEWQRVGLQEPTEVTRATQEYREEQDPLKAFIDDCCIVHHDAYVPVIELREEYAEYSKKMGQRFTMGAQKFNERMRARGFETKAIWVKGKTVKCWTGLGLVAEGVKMDFEPVDRMPLGEFVSKPGKPVITPTQGPY